MIFNKSFCTNTRLMGTMMLAIEWIDGERNISHIFMLDSEGLGISDFYLLEDMSEEERNIFYLQRYGGLGGVNVDLNEREACFLVKAYLDKNKRNEKPIPKEFNSDLISFYSNIDDMKMSIYDLMDKTCKDIETDEEFINYMVMRFIARDRECLMYFSDNEDVSTLHITKINGALLYNEIEKKGNDRFVCNCVFEDIDGYYEAKIIVNIEKRISDDDGLAYDDTKEEYKLRSILIVDLYPIYDFEVFDIISKQEILDIYNIIEKDELDLKIMDMYPAIQKVKFETGTLYSQYYFDNSHVDSDIYVINNDLMFLIFISEDKLFLATYDYESRKFIDNFISTRLKDSLVKENVFEFEQNVLYDFVESGNPDFYDFID